MEPQQITWEARSCGEDAEFAVRAGVDSGDALYVARAFHAGGVIPGKLHKGHCCIYVPYGGEEIAKPIYEVMVAPPGSLSWVDCQGGNIPENAVVGGRDPNGEKYYIGRVIHEGTVTVGKVQQSHGACYVPYGGKEYGYDVYEILVRNAYGRFLNI